MDSAVYELIIRAMELDRSIDQVMGMLPRRAISQYMDRCLIDEIVLTNGIEGVHSTRREIDDALEMLAEKDKPVGFGHRREIPCAKNTRIDSHRNVR